MEIDIYCEMYREWVKHMYNLGTCVSLAFKDLESKQKNILYNRELYVELGLITKESNEYKYLMSFIDFEIKTGLHLPWGMKREHLEQAYKAIGSNRKVDSNFKTIDSFWSTCQTIVVAGWFFDFLNFLYQEYTVNDKPMVQLGKEGYNKCLCHRHNWFIRQASNLGLNLINTRE